ncbi:MAG: Na+/H+ antiporter NhaA [Planctomycetota bacterium]|nr:Na+/H+ antiporter NhaA [Planctomycetota bacterium]MDA1248544.1 Na+/H+ antiporter NhaA [Planctomycetota bacterium]
MSGSKNPRSRVAAFVFENSIFLIGGSIIALIWANVAPDSYNHFIHHDLLGSEHAAVEHAAVEHAAEPSTEANVKEESTGESAAAETRNGNEAEEGEAAKEAEDASTGHHNFSLYFLINDLMMAFFFAIAGSEVWEALLPGGALSNPKKAATPLLATLGGLAGPAAIYMAGCYASGRMDISSGWAIPCATDIAFSYLVARFIFGAGHPAIAFLLLLAIADDAAGLIILAVFYPSGELHLSWLLASVLAVVIGFAFQKLKLHSFWWYLLIPGALSWIGFLKSGIHPALGLVPVIVTMPHAHTDLGIFAREELNQDDTLNRFTNWWADPVELILGLFGLVNAGVSFSSVGAATWLVLAGLLIGKPIGITLLTWFAQKVLKLEIPGGMNYRDVVTLGMIAGIGFTVALFVSTAAFKAGDSNLDAAKMGALASFGAAGLSIALAKFLGVKPFVPTDDSDEEASPDAA